MEDSDVAPDGLGRGVAEGGVGEAGGTRADPGGQAVKPEVCEQGLDQLCDLNTTPDD